jgi:DNA polymerase III subunit gamma/tau
MAYQVLARKWRPQDFGSLIGQEPIVTALRNALTEGRIAGAYLFSGIRGVGKTTTARLLAKALNCEHGPTGDPCNECLPCQEITRGSDLDVIEVDAATYSKVEQVRELTESLRYHPARDRYKVVVIDEIHRLSRQAFDALLKIVEEPPPHLVFIFATTEAEAVPATLLSRCQEFRFRRVPAQQLVAHLREVSTAESITASDTALRLIARAGEGSVRDAVALLDQLATFGSGAVSDEDAARLTGSLDAALFGELLAAILAGRGAEVSAVVRRVEEEGWDPRHVYGQFLAYCREGLHLALGGRPEQVDLPADDARELAEIIAGAGYENLLRLLNQMLAGEETVRRSDAGALAVEIAWLRAAELPKLVRVEELLAGGGAAAGEPAVGPRREEPPPPAAAAPPRRRSARREEAAPAAAAEPPAAADPPEVAQSEPPPPAAPPAAKREEEPGPPTAEDGEQPPAGAPAPEAAAPAAAQADGEVARFHEEVSRRRPPLLAHLKTASRLAFDAGELLIYSPPPPEDQVLSRAVERPGNRRALDEAVAATWGEGAKWRLLASPDEEAAAPGPPEEPAAAPDDEAERHPTVQAVLDIFQGTVAAVKPLGEGQED